MAGYKRRALKPALGPRTTSSNNSGSAHGRSKGSAAAAKSSTSSSTTQHHGGERRRHSTATCKAEDPVDTDPSMAQSFLPYCAHCEKQIVIPNNSILYCSEKCRRKDNTKPVAIPAAAGPYSSGYTGFSLYTITPPLSPYGRDASEPTRNIVKPLSPTPPSTSPPLGEYGPRRRLGSMDKGSVEITTPVYTNEVLSSSPTSANSANIYAPARRPHHTRRGTSGSSGVSSSIGIPVPTQYQLNNHQHRPLPPLRKPSQSSSSPRSIELVTPYLPTAAHTSTQASGEMVYERRSARAHAHQTSQIPTAPAPSTNVSGNLKMMFNFEAIRSRPTTTAPTTTAYPYQGNGDPYHRFANRPITLK